MDLAEIADVTARLSYWPGWSFTVYADPHLGLMLRIVTTRPSRDNPEGATVDLGINARVPPHALASDQAFAWWVLWRLGEAAVHEVREGLRLDGRLVDDPHA